MRVEIPAPADLVIDTSGNARVGLAVTLNLAGTATAATHYSALTGGTSSTGALFTSATGTIVGGSGGRRYVDSGQSLDITIDGQLRQVEPLTASVEREIEQLPTLPLQRLADRDGVDLFSSDGVWAQWLTDMWAEASAAGKALLLPPGVILMKGTGVTAGGAMRPPLISPQLIGHGRGNSIIRSHPSLLGSSPIISHPVEGGNVRVNDMVISDMTFDGNFDDNTAFNTRCTLTVPYTYGDTTVTVDAIPAAFPAALARPGGGQFDEGRADTLYFTYTSRSSTQFFGCEPEGSAVRDQIVGTEIFWRDRSGLGLLRLYAGERMSLVRVDVMNGPGYGFGLEGRPEAEEVESDLYMQDCRFMNNGSDGCDFKWITRYTIIRCEASDNADTGFDPRSQYGTMINCQAHRNNTGINISASRPAVLQEWSDLAITATKLDTSMTWTPHTSGAIDIPVSGSGHVGTEEVDWTGRVDNGNGTFTTTGMTRGLRGTRAVPHLVYTSVPPRLVPDFSELTTPKLSEVPDGFDFRCPTDLIGCVANDNTTGFVIDSGGQGSIAHVNVFGGGADNSGAHNVVLQGARNGTLDVTIHGGQYTNAGSDGIQARRVHNLSIFGTQISGSLGDNSFGDAIYIDGCTNGVTLQGVSLRDNVGAPVRLVNYTDYCDLNGEAYRNGLGDRVVEQVGYKHSRGTLFGTGRVLQGLMRGLLPVSDAGSAAPTAATIWSNLLDRREITSNTIAANTSGTLNLWPIWLPKDLPITRLGVLIGSTGTTTPSHSWFALYDELFALLTQTPDLTSGITAADHFSRPQDYTVPEDGLYWFGISVTAAGTPTFAGRPTIATGIVPWTRIITSNTGLLGTAPGTAVPATEGAGTAYVYFK